MERIKKCNGYAAWMLHWITTDTVEGMEVYFCFHPDNECFFISSDPQQAVDSFSRKEFAYNG